MLKEKAAEGSLMAKEATLQGLQDVDPVVRAHAVEVVSELAGAGYLNGDETRHKIDELMLNETDLRVQMSAIEALSSLAVQVAHETAAANSSGADDNKSSTWPWSIFRTCCTCSMSSTRSQL
eukprot:TRINITY_DN27706_c1_g1_i9.p1 TRINITY_DN27706_c1_g1~~TRINITY_DN27706_c1_g1_i9.p1  ORF type:complete len:133 (-),score=33.07 TRINITY_DN27706_c1_g1_i9:41-406(-)